MPIATPLPIAPSPRALIRRAATHTSSPSCLPALPLDCPDHPLDRTQPHPPRRPTSAEKCSRAKRTQCPPSHATPCPFVAPDNPELSADRPRHVRAHSASSTPRSPSSSRQIEPTAFQVTPYPKPPKATRHPPKATRHAPKATRHPPTGRHHTHVTSRTGQPPLPSPSRGGAGGGGQRLLLSRAQGKGAGG